VRDVIAPLRGEDDRRFSVGGPPMLLSSAATFSVSMMLHELATNAVKYGALSNDSGRISISWTVEERRDEADFRLQWQEYGGPRWSRRSAPVSARAPCRRWRSKLAATCRSRTSRKA